MNLSADLIAQISQYDAEKRYQFLLKHVVQQQEIWILTDEHGCVMLNTEDEDCVPVWPAEEFAKQWATDDWAHCQPLAISMKDWRQRWVPGLLDDELSVVVFPLGEEAGLVIYPDELDDDLYKAAKKSK
uniref:DUF2750 domain-containing protein n=1 Tax=Thaumasiovibrio occultus TaxID=1891184 RepID=UPI000B35FDAB|nr:DUF2750 domain-containing protein [Thaumasiovibrio occultus]